MTRGVSPPRPRSAFAFSSSLHQDVSYFAPASYLSSRVCGGACAWRGGAGRGGGCPRHATHREDALLGLSRQGRAWEGRGRKPYALTHFPTHCVSGYPTGRVSCRAVPCRVSCYRALLAITAARTPGSTEKSLSLNQRVESHPNAKKKTDATMPEKVVFL